MWDEGVSGDGESHGVTTQTGHYGKEGRRGMGPQNLLCALDH